MAQQYERHLSAASLAGGYAFDSYSFGRVDHASTHVVFVAYLADGGRINGPHRHLIFVVGLLVLGSMVAYQVNRVRALSRYYERRPLPR